MRLLSAFFLSFVSLWAQAPQRIVSTSPSITETLFALGLGSRVIGVSNYCHFPPEVDWLPRVGTYLKPNVEVIARLKPDLVFVQRLPNQVRDQLRGLSIRVAEIESGDLQKNLSSMRAIGQAAGAERAANDLVEHIKTELSSLTKARAGREPATVAFIVGRTPGRLEGLVAVGGSSFLSELMASAGGRNIFADSNQDYVKISLELLVRRNPDVLIDMGDMSATVAVTEQAKRTIVDMWSSRSELKAARERRVYAVASDIFVVPGPRMVEAARAFAAMFDPAPAK
jgi:iron complex transport system substrate-binding protein